MAREPSRGETGEHGRSSHERAPAHRHHRIRILGALPRDPAPARRASRTSRSSRRRDRARRHLARQQLSRRRLRRRRRSPTASRSSRRPTGRASGRRRRRSSTTSSTARASTTCCRTSASAARSPRARFDAQRSVWRLRTRAGEEIEAEVLVSGVGQLNRPCTARDPGSRAISRRRASTRRAGITAASSPASDVAVIGNAASAIQFIPEIAPRVRQPVRLPAQRQLDDAALDRAYTEREKRALRAPALAGAALPLVDLARLRDALARVPRQRLHGRQTLGSSPSEHLREQRRAIRRCSRRCVPDYPIGGKRILISDDYYPALQRENVQRRRRADRAHHARTAS